MESRCIRMLMEAKLAQRHLKISISPTNSKSMHLKMGFRYCIKNFVVDDGSVYYAIKEKFDMPTFLTFVENRSRWNSKQKIDYIYKPFTCLAIYNDKDYDDEAKRIVKKYCKDCE